MGNRLLLILAFACLILGLAAQEIEAVSAHTALASKPAKYVQNPQRTVPEYSFTINPTGLLTTSFYDYMIGSYNGIPLQVVPGTTPPDYFVTYQGKRAANSMRRVFYSYINGGTLQINNEITEAYVNEGFPAIAIDPLVGKPLYAWNANYDNNTLLDVYFSSDAFISEIAGLINSSELVVNNPVSVTANNSSTTDNVFLWPQITTGPSPIYGKRRVYVMCKNATVHGSTISENPLIAMADFNADDIETGTPFTWTYRTVPELDAWNVDNTISRRPFLTMLCDDAGNLYLCGYHTTEQNSSHIPILEDDLDVFKCNNYGTGAWNRMTSESNLPTWNPPAASSSPAGYFTHNNLPVADSELFWRINNSSHMNAVMDNSGKIHMPGLWALTNIYGEYYPHLQFMKEMIFDPGNNQFSIRDICPQKHPDDSFNTCYQPWDIQYPFGTVDFWEDEDTNSTPGMVSMWNFPYWDATAHNNAMMSLYNNNKITQNKENEMMAVVWQNCTRAWIGPADNSNPWQHTPEIFISVSPDNGQTWSEPIILNNIDTPQLAGRKPMWVYPANQITYMGLQNGHKVGKLGLIFYDDYTWGANSISPPVHNNIDGGRVMFMELQIVFPEINPASDPFGQPVGLANMTINARVFIDNQPAQAGDKLAAYVETDGVLQLRGKATIIPTGVDGSLGCRLGLYTSADNEQIQFKIWDASSGILPFTNFTISSVVNGEIGAWPNNLIEIHSTSIVVENPYFIPAAGTYTSPQLCYILCLTAGAEIRYTTNGWDPNPQSNLYTGPFMLQTGSNVTLKARAYYPGWIPSSITSATYHITGVLSAPSFYPAPGTYQSALNLTITYPVGTDVTYTFDGSDPTTDSFLYLAPIHFAQNTVTHIKARAFREGWVPSPVTQGIYTITGTLPLPTFDPPAGSYETSLDVSLSSAIPGSIIHYTIDATIPDESSAIYTEPIHLTENTTIKARSYKIGWATGPVGEAFYQFPNANHAEQDTPPYSGIYSLYPNPFSDRIIIRLGIKGERQAYKVEIFNIRGARVYSENGLADGYVDFSWNGKDRNGRRLASGIYLIKFQSPSGSQIRKLLMQ